MKATNRQQLFSSQASFCNFVAGCCCVAQLHRGLSGKYVLRSLYSSYTERHGNPFEVKLAEKHFELSFSDGSHSQSAESLQCSLVDDMLDYSMFSNDGMMARRASFISRAKEVSINSNGAALLLVCC